MSSAITSSASSTSHSVLVKQSFGYKNLKNADEDRVFLTQMASSECHNVTTLPEAVLKEFKKAESAWCCSQSRVEKVAQDSLERLKEYYLRLAYKLWFNWKERQASPEEADTSLTLDSVITYGDNVADKSEYFMEDLEKYFSSEDAAAIFEPLNDAARLVSGKSTEITHEGLKQLINTNQSSNVYPFIDQTQESVLELTPPHTPPPVALTFPPIFSSSSSSSMTFPSIQHEKSLPYAISLSMSSSSSAPYASVPITAYNCLSSSVSSVVQSTASLHEKSLPYVISLSMSSSSSSPYTSVPITAYDSLSSSISSVVQSTTSVASSVMSSVSVSLSNTQSLISTKSIAADSHLSTTVNAASEEQLSSLEATMPDLTAVSTRDLLSTDSITDMEGHYYTTYAE